MMISRVSSLDSITGVKPPTTEEDVKEFVVLVLVGSCPEASTTAVVMECCCCVRQEIEVKTLLEECTTASYSGESGSCKEEEKGGLELEKESWGKEIEDVLGITEDILGTTEDVEVTWE